MKTPAARGATVVALASLVLGWGATSASADKWSAEDASGDVTKYRYTPDPPPCGTLTQAVLPADTTTDLVALTARHRKDTVELSAQFRDLTGWGQQFVSFDLETDGRTYEVVVERYRTGGAIKASVMTAASEPPTPNECGAVLTIQGVEYCPDVSADMSPAQDLVSVVVPRSCLKKPRWIRAGVEAIRFLGDSGRSDRWAPEGADTTAISGPFGPKLRRG